MRLFGMILALAAVVWLLYHASGGDKSAGAMPEGYRQSMEKARGVEQVVHDAASRPLEDLDKNEE